jgi:hypothetical protein
MSANLIDSDFQYVRSGLLLLKASFIRQRVKQVSGSAMFKALSVEIDAIQSVLIKCGG